MGYFEPDGERMRKVLCLRNDVRNVSSSFVYFYILLFRSYSRNI